MYMRYVKDMHPNSYGELRSEYKYYIDLYIALYQLKTEKEEELNSIYKMIKTEMIDSKKYSAKNITRDILNIIPYNNHYTKSYLFLAKQFCDDYHVEKISKVINISNYLFYQEYGIKLSDIDDFDKNKPKNLNIHTEDTIYSAIMDNDKERFISFIEREGFDKDKKLDSDLYPLINASLLELCCYHGAVGCFKLLRAKFNSKITRNCLNLSFLGRNPEIMNECLKYQQPDGESMKYAIISHNIDFVTFLMNKYDLIIDLYDCESYNNLDSFLVYYDQMHDLNSCFVKSACFNIPSLCKYFLSHGANIDVKNMIGETALHIAAINNSKETAELLIKNGADIYIKDMYCETALYYAVINNCKETVELLITNGANVNNKNKNGHITLHDAALRKYKEIVELLISHGANANEKDNDGKTALHIAATNNCKEIAELLITNGININEKDKYGSIALHNAAVRNNKEIAKLLISHGININEKDNDGKTALHYAVINNCKEIAELLISHDANINEKQKK
ncbi:ankyrin repeat protein, putative [Trichomonas vaginalis G3]|uniref:Ankyrin repeat protein, putative n=1 Tax=Trichomonas vaginalis (strain ATCC PRA-98 / G3) TaxID=412133 RepID=A2F0C2_TRIV3|nr:ankyrin repeat and SOCS box-containing protein 4 family [Trichomonas vaginalis G3]EAY01617.1 ankyrin repeat protein, putative [Trichomonas vaginalis G3]KAI5551581.1 ankyrin repeat and SOCS box-containing protein 4 family [Trichomonas vaginalis G3]|eukprot:XP_001314234.1 ankyrin repeat protein [Trichomonas vaginalis G3]